MIRSPDHAEREDRPHRRQELPIHVAVLTNIIPPHQRELYIELSRRVARLTVLVSAATEPGKWPDWRPDWGPLDVRLQRTTTLHRPWRHPAGFVDSAYVHVPWDTVPLLWKLRPDVVISSELGCRTLFSAVYACVMRRTPLIVWAALSEHTERGRGWTRHLLRKWLVRRAAGLIVNGASGERYVRGLGYCSPNVFHVPYAAVPDTFDRNPAFRGAETAHRLLYVGQLSHRKGILPFTQALARWATSHGERRVEFMLAGSGPLQPQIQALPTPSNMSVRFLGECNYRQIAECCGRAGIFVFPTHADEWGLVVNEAMAAGLPVLGSVYSQAVEELCVDGVTGWTFRPDAAGQLMRTLDRAMNTPVSRLNEMRLAARAKVQPLHPRHTADRVVRAVQTALDTARRGSSRRSSARRTRAAGSARIFPHADRGGPENSPAYRLVSHLGLRGAGHVGAGLNGLLGSRARQTIGILSYHRVVPPIRGVPRPPDNVTPDRFREHVAGLLARGFVFRPLRSVLQCCALRASIPPRTVVLTFDDGYEGVYAHAFPVLRQFRVPATVFVSTAYLDEAGPFPFDSWGTAHRDRLPADTYRPLTTPQCREMIHSGLVELGLHTHTHQDFRRRPKEFGEDLRSSAQVLRSRFGQRELTFAFPYGQSHRGFAGEELVAEARQAGALCGLTSDPLPVDPQSDPFRWGRFNVFPWDTSATLAAKLGGWYSWTVGLRRAVFRLLNGRRPRNGEHKTGD